MSQRTEHIWGISSYGARADWCVGGVSRVAGRKALAACHAGIAKLGKQPDSTSENRRQRDPREEHYHRCGFRNDRKVDLGRIRLTCQPATGEAGIRQRRDRHDGKQLTGLNALYVHAEISNLNSRESGSRKEKTAEPSPSH